MTGPILGEKLPTLLTLLFSSALTHSTNTSTSRASIEHRTIHCRIDISAMSIVVVRSSRIGTLLLLLMLLLMMLLLLLLLLLLSV